MSPRLLLAALVACAACAGEPADGAADDFLDPGKSDGVSVSEGSPEARGVLALVNQATRDTLDDEVGIDARAAAGIVAHRDGGDPFDTLAELDAVPYVGPRAFALLLEHARSHGFVSQPGVVRLDSLPAGLAPLAPLVEGLAGDPSLGLDGDARTLTPGEWELALVYLHHFGLGTQSDIAAMRPFLSSGAPASGPFLDLATLPLTRRVDNYSDALQALVRRSAADPRHVAGRISAAELGAAVADPAFFAAHPGLFGLRGEYLGVWDAHPQPTRTDLPADRAAAHALLASRDAPVFTAPYPPDRPVPAAVAAMQLRFPFPSGTEILCLQGHNTMVAGASHGPDQLRYALDLGAAPGTPVVASVGGTAYVYGGGRHNEPDNFGFGNIVLVDAGNGYALLYAHLDTFAVQNGQRVTAGQPLGTIGTTGLVGTDAHLHFQVVPLLRTPDPTSPDAPFGGPERFALPAIDLTAGATRARSIDSMDFVGAEAGWLMARGHVYRAP